MNNSIVIFKKIVDSNNRKYNIKKYSIKILYAPHEPNKKPKNKFAIYAFVHNGKFLKIGKCGPKSYARFNYQHYNPKSTNSNLAKSILLDKNNYSKYKINKTNIAKWIKNNCTRIEVIFDDRVKDNYITYLESLLILELEPKYEK